LSVGAGGANLNTQHLLIARGCGKRSESPLAEIFGSLSKGGSGGTVAAATSRGWRWSSGADIMASLADQHSNGSSG